MKIPCIRCIAIRFAKEFKHSKKMRQETAHNEKKEVTDQNEKHCKQMEHYNRSFRNGLLQMLKRALFLASNSLRVNNFSIDKEILDHFL